MKRFISQLALLYFVSTTVFAQVDFEPGYYITNSGDRNEGLILNFDWKNNPKKIIFKTSENASEKEIYQNDVIEFGIHGFSKYERLEVEFDKSLNNSSNLSTQRNPLFEIDTLLLKVLIDGKLTLYKYEDLTYLRFFYSEDDAKPIALVYKRYFVTRVEKIGENVTFRQQITNLQFTPEFRKRLEKVVYRENSLVQIFEELNEDENFVKYSSERLRFIPHLSITAGTRLLSSTFNNNASKFSGDSPLTFAYMMGVDAELILPFRKEAWSLFFGGYYNSYNGIIGLNYNDGAGNMNVGELDINYNVAEINAGFRNRFFINGIPKIYASGSFSIHLPITNDLDLPDFERLILNRSYNFNFGVGVYLAERIQVEVFYSSPRNFLSTYTFWNAKQQGAGLFLRYRFL